MLEKLVPQNLPYPIRGAIIRGIRTFVAFLLAGIAASIADGSLIAGLGGIIPPAYTPVVTLLLTTTFASIDKFLRERGLVQEAQDNVGVPTSDEATTPSVVDVPAPAVNVNDGEVTDVPAVEEVDPVEFDDPVLEDTGDKIP